jgi:3-hydroxybutyrate dehydrogenase
MSSNTDDWNKLLNDKVVFLTGAAGGVARACYVHGVRLVLGDLNTEAIDKIKDEILAKEDKEEDRILVVKLDVKNEKSIQQAVQTTLDKWQTIDVLIDM